MRIDSRPRAGAPLAAGEHGVVTAERWDELAAALAGPGWWWCPDFLPAAEVTALRADLLARRPQLRPAAIGRAGQRQLDRRERGDYLLWRSGAGGAQQLLLARMEALRGELNRRLLLGLFDYEAHYAVYPPGAEYRRHFDTFSNGSGSGNSSNDSPSRVLSSVVYLNEAWPLDAGGELVLWDGADRELARLAPQGGAALFFLSARFPHAVLATARERYSIPGWFRRRGGESPVL
jgi:SM-20-related protein